MHEITTYSDIFHLAHQFKDFAPELQDFQQGYDDVYSEINEVLLYDEFLKIQGYIDKLTLMLDKMLNSYVFFTFSKDRFQRTYLEKTKAVLVVDPVAELKKKNEFSEMGYRVLDLANGK